MVNIENKKDRYRKLCDERNDIPLFMQAWWMDAVCGEKNWDLIIYEKNCEILGVWVFHFIKKNGFRVVIQPILTQTNGIWIKKPNKFSDHKPNRFDNEIITSLIDQFESNKISYFEQNFHHSFTNWLPFYWRGYEQTTRYSYIIENISNPEECLKQFKYSKRSLITKAQKTIRIDFQLSGSDFYDSLKVNLQYLGKKIYYSKESFLRILEACQSRNQGCIIAAYDNKNNLHAAIFIIWDENCAYNLITTIKPEYRASGASSLIFFEAIKLMSKKTKSFDFEGSMNESIAKSYQRFGTVQIPYFQIKKNNSIIFRILYFLKKWT